MEEKVCKLCGVVHKKGRDSKTLTPLSDKPVSGTTVITVDLH